ncbi:MAG: hypothetical protein GF317_04025 [Candidatus Lokiarchaeota archaeon]|nr:hypothetical protein [Candidatus Lokiarchaeota archaeon]MBD3199054.1 hypothetical protein [Candidatus Lokiarchaeota archaeon]
MQHSKPKKRELNLNKALSIFLICELHPSRGASTIRSGLCEFDNKRGMYLNSFLLINIDFKFCSSNNK